MEPKPSIRRILVPVDFEPGSDVVFAHALRLALSAGATLTAVHVQDDPNRPVSWTSLPSARDLLVAWGLLPPEADETDVEALGLHVMQELRPEANPAAGIMHSVNERMPNVIVVGTHRRTGWERLRKGSVSEAVARRSGAITLFVPAGVRPLIEPMTGAPRIRHVVFPAGGPEMEMQHAVDVLAAFLEVLGVDDATVAVTHAGEGPGPRLALPDHRGWRWVHEARVGSVVDVVTGCARDHASDLVVMGTRGHDSLGDVLTGSLTEQVVRRAPCAVLAVPLGH